MATKKAIFDESYKALITALVEHRVAHGITQEQLSEMTGIQRYDISKVERFVRELRINELDLWLRAVKVHPNLTKDMISQIRKN